jgi:hypothetical protein
MPWAFLLQLRVDSAGLVRLIYTLCLPCEHRSVRFAACAPRIEGR